jgi:hypothetical protein
MLAVVEADADDLLGSGDERCKLHFVLGNNNG